MGDFWLSQNNGKLGTSSTGLLSVPLLPSTLLVLLVLKKQLLNLHHLEGVGLISTKSPHAFFAKDELISCRTFKDDCAVGINSHTMVDDSMLLETDDLDAPFEVRKPREWVSIEHSSLCLRHFPNSNLDWKMW